MANVTVFFKDGTNRVYEDHGRPGGSYSQSLRYEGAFAIITDAWGKEIALPVDSIREIIKDAPRGGW